MLCVAINVAACHPTPRSTTGRLSRWGLVFNVRHNDTTRGTGEDSRTKTASLTGYISSSALAVVSAAGCYLFYRNRAREQPELTPAIAAVPLTGGVAATGAVSF